HTHTQVCYITDGVVKRCGVDPVRDRDGGDGGKFQTGDVATTESFLDTGLGDFPLLRQMTMVVHLRLRRVTSHIPLLNYAVEGCNEELFVELVPKKKDMHVQCCGGLVSEAFKFKLRMFTWQHISVSLNLETRILLVIY
ncbi:hypothetical protein Hamer_G022632, partial [Homarus americanus]